MALQSFDLDLVEASEEARVITTNLEAETDDRVRIGFDDQGMALTSTFNPVYMHNAGIGTDTMLRLIYLQSTGNVLYTPLLGHLYSYRNSRKAGGTIARFHAQHLASSKKRGLIEAAVGRKNEHYGDDMGATKEQLGYEIRKWKTKWAEKDAVP